MVATIGFAGCLTLPLMLWELSVAEQRYWAVLEVGAGVPVTEVAERYQVLRQSVHTWLRRYRQEGIAGLEDRSHRVREHPCRIAAEVEEAICELRRRHPRWGPRRLVFEMDRRGLGRVTRSTVYRTLVRNGLIEPVGRDPALPACAGALKLREGAAARRLRPPWPSVGSAPASLPSLGWPGVLGKW
jgi:transposase